MKKIILLILLIPLLIPLVLASPINFYFDLSKNSTIQHPGLIYSDRIVFQISTTKDVLCRYSNIRGRSFDAMSGGIFDENLEIVHKKVLTDLHDGVYRYFVKCRDINNLNNQSQGINELEAIFRISNPIKGQIIFENDPLSSGKYEIKLITTKIPKTTPKLSYTYDTVSYSPIILQGSGTNWKGYIIIPDSPIESIGRFKFEAEDLEGRKGAEIIGQKSFFVDTKKPLTPQILEAIGEYGQIRLEWYSEEKDISKVNIYRTEDPPVRINSFYKSINSGTDRYTDTDVENGKTYYYRISLEDEAGNIADLSREVKAIALLSNDPGPTTLSLELISTVDALLTEVELLKDDITRAEGMFSLEDEKSQDYLNILGLSESIKSSKASLNALKREVEGFKLQNLKKEILNSKVSSSRARLNILRKKVPDSFSILENKETEYKINPESLRSAIVEKSPELTPDSIDISVEESVSNAEKNNIKIRNSITAVEIIYLDGSKEDKSIIEHTIDGKIIESEGSFILLGLPPAIADDSSLKIINADYSKEKENLVGFKIDTKKISYIVDKRISQETFNEIGVNPVTILESKPFLTGYFLSELKGAGSIGVTFLIIVASSLAFYLIYVRRKTKPSFVLDFIEKAKGVKELRRQGKIEESDALYRDLKEDYLKLSNEEKSKVFKEVKHLTNKK